MFKKFFLPPAPASSQIESIDLNDAYHRLINENNYRLDHSQINVVHYLQKLLDKLLLLDQARQPGGPRHSQTQVIKGHHLYLFGGVGMGKSMLMDLFFNACPIKHKRRVHFHAFMQEVHAFIHQWEGRSKGDVIINLAKQIRTTTLLLCFDEFHVTDIADAMIMERLFRTLFEQGVVVVMTSNRHPSNLYRGGLLRDQFIPFVDLLMDSAKIVELDGHVDYRTICESARERRYFCPLSPESDQFVRQQFFSCSHCSAMVPGSLRVFGRDISLTAVHHDTVLTSFQELCCQTLGAADYLHIAARFKTVIMADIPRLTPEYCNQAKRFETFIDALYEHRVKFICSAATRPEDIYKEGEGAFEFRRTVSRLLEMQSNGY